MWSKSFEKDGTGKHDPVPGRRELCTWPHKYDLVVIGGGTAGLVSAAGAASLGARVALVERNKLGGECLYSGCVPTKTLVKSARVASLVNHAEEYGIKTGVAEVDFPAVMDRMHRAIRTVAVSTTPRTASGSWAWRSSWETRPASRRPTGSR